MQTNAQSRDDRHDETSPDQGAGAGRAALWASAFVLAALTMFQASRGGGAAAFGATVASVGDLTALTTRSTVDEDVLCILDAHSDTLLVYRVENQARIELQQSIKLAEAFAEAAAGGAQGPRRR